MSRRPKGGMGAGRKKVGKQEPLVSESWSTLATTTISMLETVGALNDDAADDCIEEAAQLAEMNKKRMGFQSRMQLLDAVTQMIEGFLGAFADLSAEQREEHGIAELFENFYGSMFSIITESIEGIAADGAAPKQQEELQQQIALTLRLIDVLIAVSFENDEATALEYFKPFVSTLFELCCTQLCLGGARYDFFVRQMALGLMTELIEAKHLNPLLADPEHKGLVELLINTCFSLCADEADARKEEGEAAAPAKAAKAASDDEDEEEEDEEGKSLDPNEETSQNLGTQLLDTLTASLHAADAPDQSIAAPLIFAKSQGILADATASKLDRKAALVCLAVLPEAATSFSKDPANLASVMSLIKRFMAAGEESLVRSGAFIALSEHLEHLQPEIASYHEEVLTTILSVLADPVDKSNYLVKIKACIPLNQLTNSSATLPLRFLQADSPDSLFKFLLAQVKTLADKEVAARTSDEQDLLQSLITNVSNMAQQYAEGAKAARLPAAAGNYLEASAPEAFELLLSVAESATTAESWAVRGEASSALGQLAQTLDKAAVVAAMPRLSKLLVESMDLTPEGDAADEDEKLPSELYELRGSTHATWSGLAQKLGDDILPFVESILPGVLRCLSADYGADEEEEEPEDEDEDPQMPSGDDDDKAAPNSERQFALECYQHLLQALGPKFAPFHSRCMLVITDNAKAYAPEVQLQLVYVLAAVMALHPLDQSVVLTPGVDAPLSDDAKATLTAVRALLFDYVQHATDSEVVEAALDALTALANTYGQALVNDSPDSVEAVEKFAAKLLKRRAPCQSLDSREVGYFNPSDVFGGFGGEDGEDEEEEEEDEEEEEEAAEGEDGDHVHGPGCSHDDGHGHGDSAEDAPLFESLLNMLGALAKAKGAAFRSTIDTLMPRILKLRKESAYAGAVAGFFADLADGFGDDLFPALGKDMMPLLIADVTSTEFDTMTWRNSAFAVGQLFLKTSLANTQEYLEPAATGLQAILAALEAKATELKPKAAESAALRAELDDVLGCRDNVISALGKMLMVGSEQLPRATLVPLFVSGLPLANDFAESQNVYSAVVKLINTYPQAHPGVLEVHFPRLLQVFAGVIAQQGEAQKVSEQLKAFMLKGAKTILQLQPALRADVVDKIEDQAVREAFVAKIDAAE